MTYGTTGRHGQVWHRWNSADTRCRVTRDARLVRVDPLVWLVPVVPPPRRFGWLGRCRWSTCSPAGGPVRPPRPLACSL